MAKKLIPVSYCDLTDYQRQTLAWLDAQPGPVSEADVWLSGVARWVDLPDLQAAGQAFEDKDGWHATKGWLRLNMAFVYREALRVWRCYRQYDRDECAAMLVPFAYQFARTMKPDGGAKFITYFGRYGVKNLLCSLASEAGLIRVPKWKGEARRTGEFVPATVTHFGSTGDYEGTGVPEPAATDDGTAERAEASEVWSAAMRALKPSYQAVLRRRMRGERLQHIAADMGLTRERIRQIEFAALNLVRERLGVPQVERSKKAAKKAKNRVAALLPGVGA
jgi:hypothetical protein